MLPNCVKRGRAARYVNVMVGAEDDPTATLMLRWRFVPPSPRQKRNLNESEMEALTRQVGGDHYKSMSIQPVEFCQRNRLGFCESSAIKYICRHQAKNGKEDIRKAIHFLEMLLEFEYPDER